MAKPPHVSNLDLHIRNPRDHIFVRLNQNIAHDAVDCQCNDTLLQESESAIALAGPRCIIHALDLDQASDLWMVSIHCNISQNSG